MHPIEKAVRQFGLLEPGERVLACVSGGADSMAMLHWLRFCSGLRVSACHLNHCLRGEESLRDETFVRRLCGEWGVPLLVKTADVAAEAKAAGSSVEEAGREARYTFFEEAAAWAGADKICTAHTLSDNLETLLFRLGRGTGLPGLCGIPLRRGRIIRPLLLCGRAEVEAYCAENGVPYVTDSTNLIPGYARNRIRLEAVPALKAVCPGAEAAAGRMAALLTGENDFLKQEAGKAKIACMEREGLSCARLGELHPALQRRVLSGFLRESGLAEDFGRVERLRALAAEGGGRLDLSGGAVVIKNGVLRLDLPPLPPFEVWPDGEGGTLLPDGRCFQMERLSVDSQNMPQNVYKNLLYLHLDYDKINGKISIRQKIPGDSVSIIGRGGHKTLKKLFSGAGMTARERSEAAVFTDECGVIAVWGFGPDKRCALSERTQTILRIKLLPPGTDKNGKESSF